MKGDSRYFFDFARAFDCVNHDILLEKLFYYGICGTIFHWFKFYLTTMEPKC